MSESDIDDYLNAVVADMRDTADKQGDWFIHDLLTNYADAIETRTLPDWVPESPQDTNPPKGKS